MKQFSTLYLLGMFLIFLGERLIGDSGGTRYLLNGLGLAIVLVSDGFSHDPRVTCGETCSVVPRSKPCRCCRWLLG